MENEEKEPPQFKKAVSARREPLEQPNNPLHGKTLLMILEHLVDVYGWDELYDRIPVNCFGNQPSIKSSLKFLRRTPWAREKVELLYLKSIGF